MEVIENRNLIGSVNGVLVGGATLVVGKKGLALYTNGVDQYVDYGCQGDTCLGSISLCVHGWVTAFWVHPADDTFGVIMDTGLYGHERVVIFVNNAAFKTRLWGPNNVWDVSISLPNQQGWIHLVLTWQPGYGVKFYIDGELADIDNLPSDPYIPAYDKPRFILGAGNKHTDMYKMSLDELRVWDTVMGDDQVLALYAADAGLHWDISSQWRHNGCESISNHQPHDCLLNRLFRHRSKITSKLRVTGLCVGNSPGTGEFPAQMASNAENVSIWWRHHVITVHKINW